MIVLNKNCGECSSCLSYKLGVRGDCYMYSLNAGTDTYSEEYFRILEGSFANYSWRDVPTMPTCVYSSWSTTYTYWHTINNFFGCIVKGKIGDSKTIKMPYRKYTRSITSQANSTRKWCTAHNSASDVSSAGTLTFDFTIEESDVLFTNEDGSVYAGYNVVAQSGENVLQTINGTDYIIGSDSNFELPSPPTNTTYLFNSDDF